MENDYLWLGLAGLCVVLIVVGVVLLITSMRRRNPALGKRNYGHQPVPTTVHSIDDLPMDFERAVEPRSTQSRPAQPRSVPPRPVPPRPVVTQRPQPVQNFNSQRLSPDPEDRVLSARPVGPLTSWDPIKPAMPQRPAMQEKPIVREQPMVQERSILKERLSLLEKPAVQETPVAKEIPQAPAKLQAPAPAFDNDERLLLLKSHELLLTLSEGLKKISSAKTDASRKEKIGEMMRAVSLLDAKNLWDEYKSCFDKINPEFWTRIEKSSDEPMSPYELRLCALLAMGMGAKEAAELTNRSVRTVETSIYKIRKKLNIDTEEKTQDYLKRLL